MRTDGRTGRYDEVSSRFFSVLRTSPKVVARSRPTTLHLSHLPVQILRFELAGETGEHFWPCPPRDHELTNDRADRRIKKKKLGCRHVNYFTTP